MESFYQSAQYQSNPLRKLQDFIDNDSSLEKAKKYDEMRFVGYVLDIGYDEAKIITSDPYKIAVGGIPRGSFLIMTPDNFDNMPPHFTLLRVSGTSSTPLAQDTQQTYFELHKKSMPELDKWTIGELQWGALTTDILGMFYPSQEDDNKIEFSGDVNNIVSAHHYKVYAPTDELLELIINGMVREDGKYTLGKFRPTECQLPFQKNKLPNVDVNISTKDFIGFRTAMFGKTRLGKSNVVKLIARSIIETTKIERNVGQVIFDINGEYANDNPQDGNKSIRSAYPDRCQVYALNPREATPSNHLKLNFYEQPQSTINILKSLLIKENRGSIYIKSFQSVEMPSIDEIKKLSPNERTRSIRKVQYFWAILKSAGFNADETRLKTLGLSSRNAKDFNPCFNKGLREEAYRFTNKEIPAEINTLNQLVSELKVINQFRRENPEDKSLISSSGNPMFDVDDQALLDFLDPKSGSGPIVLRPFKEYHSPQAGDFVKEILEGLDEGKTIILDLGSATDEIRNYFADMLSKEVFLHQEKKFTSNTLNNSFIQLYFEEAHNLFPKNDSDFTGVYTRFAKEGAKFHIGLIYSTQSPSTINKELLAQTENFFIGHISSIGEVNALAGLQIAFDGIQKDITHTKKPGYMRMLTFSHRFVVPVQANKFEVV